MFAAETTTRVGSDRREPHHKDEPLRDRHAPSLQEKSVHKARQGKARYLLGYVFSSPCLPDNDSGKVVEKAEHVRVNEPSGFADSRTD